MSRVSYRVVLAVMVGAASFGCARDNPAFDAITGEGPTSGASAPSDGDAASLSVGDATGSGDASATSGATSAPTTIDPSDGTTIPPESTGVDPPFEIPKCCTAHVDAGCGDAEIESCVCAMDSYCCEMAWDTFCVAQASATCGQQCPRSCCASGPWPGCSDPELANTVCADMPQCCDDQWGASCQGHPAVAEACLGDNDCCVSANTPGCDDPEIVACVCALDDYCCTHSWDVFCIGTAILDCGQGGCTDVPPGNCCVAGPGPGCDDPIVEDAVCQQQVSCCTVVWDDGCALLAAEAGGCDSPQDCCIATIAESPGCNDPAVAACVCANDPFCCTVEWDGMCASAALNTCDGCDG
jgi:hypothetical protein